MSPSEPIQLTEDTLIKVKCPACGDGQRERCAYCEDTGTETISLEDYIARIVRRVLRQA